MLERVQRAWDRLHHRPLLYRRVSGGDGDDATTEDSAEDWQPMMTASLYCPGPGGELVVDCRGHKTADATQSVVDDGGWGSLTLGRAQRRCRCRCSDKAALVGMSVPLGDDLAATDSVRQTEPLPRFKSPVVGRRLQTLVADDHSASVASGSASCPGSPRDIARLSAVVGRRLQLGLSPRLSTRRVHRRPDVPVNVNSHQPRQVFEAFVTCADEVMFCRHLSVCLCVYKRLRLKTTRIFTQIYHKCTYGQGIPR